MVLASVSSRQSCQFCLKVLKKVGRQNSSEFRHLELYDRISNSRPPVAFAAWVSNDTGELTVTKQALAAKHLPVTDVLLGDESFGRVELTQLYAKAGGRLLTPKQLPAKNHTWKHDLYDYRKEAIELLFQRVIQASDLKQCQVKGNGKNGVFALASVWLFQIVFLSNYRQ